MYSSQWTTTSTGSFSECVDRIADAVRGADAVLVGAGAGLSAAAGFSYAGKRFDDNFADFRAAYGITDMYVGGFYPFPDQETYWAWWSHMIWLNRYVCPVGQPYQALVQMLHSRDYFVLTTNVDHQFQRAGIERDRLFYTQGDYDLLQCSKPCHQATYDNEDIVCQMVERQRDLRVPTELVPRCPRCGEPMVPNLRCDDAFVEDEGWHAAARRYDAFLHRHRRDRLVLLEVGVGGNTPGIVKYPFWRMASQNRHATYVQLNRGEMLAPAELGEKSIILDCDAVQALSAVRERLG
ncbi:Sir2 silent information regulator family NAD-dependent deacetylase [Olsenella sp. Marseille-P4559]|uniref:SIR2 family NAD-dependent protein deacylase n=1 Tax=Olsenella sp. Marseille-P4559 TaxID=2364795 RepID=UPI001031B5AE|nr:Sir2 silent information regulator family NAD-dependent deacetylase [Olsenella sp. Marseille-P4559]